MFSWFKYLIVSLFFSHLGFWSGSLFLIAPFPDLCLLVLYILHGQLFVMTIILLPYIRLHVSLVMWPGPFIQSLIRISSGWFTWNLALISEETKLLVVNDHWYDLDLEHSHYIINSISRIF